ncbi:phage tail assembly protein [Methylophaga sp.]|uniref:phage tail assembly protein n=1 Tax=Methylophaga sp. TaxID=2024840 RepID=UPI003A8D379B
MSQVLELSKPIDAYGEEVTTLELKEPTSGDIIKLGHPLNINPDQSWSFRTNVIAGYIAKLGAIPMKSVEQLSPSDFNTASVMVASFFME